jgi:hypothetical protein
MILRKEQVIDIFIVGGTTEDLVQERIEKMLGEKFPNTLWLDEPIRITRLPAKSILITGTASKNSIRTAEPMIIICPNACSHSIPAILDALHPYFDVRVNGGDFSFHPKQH